MPELFVEKIADFAEGDRRVVLHDGTFGERHVLNEP